MVTETTYEEVITYEEETYYTYETYYTTELVQPQTGLTVKVYNQLPTSNPQRSDTAYNLCKTTTLTSINHDWSGGDILGCGSDRVMLHYTGYITPTENITSLMGQADDGFYLNINGSNVINNWTLKGCGGNWNPVTLEKGKTYEIDAWFFEWGGGACSILNYQSNNGSGVVPESWYTNAISAPLIKDPALKIILDAAQETYDEASLELNSAQQLQSQAQTSYETATSENTEAQSQVPLAEAEFNTASDALAEKETIKTTKQEVVTVKAVQKTEVEATLTAVSTEVQTATTNELTTSTTLAKADETFQVASTTEAVQLSTKAVVETEAATTQTQLETTYKESVTELGLISFNEAETILKELELIPEEGSKEIPTELSAENLMEVNLAEVDPTELTEAQAEQLVEAALQTFETAEAGSPEYEQALDALFLAAQQDDIEVDPALAAIPGVGAAVQGIANAINFFGNAGADMSPKVREESEKIVVTAVVAAGAAIQSAAAAASTASASTRRN
jgi:hypothetical protein